MMIKEYNQLIHWKYAYVARRDLVCKKEKIKCNNIMKQYKET